MKSLKFGEFKLDFTDEIQKEFIKQNETKLIKHINLDINYRKTSKINAINSLVNYLNNICDVYISFDLLDKMCLDCGVKDDNI